MNNQRRINLLEKALDEFAYLNILKDEAEQLKALEMAILPLKEYEELTIPNEDEKSVIIDLYATMAYGFLALVLLGETPIKVFISNAANFVEKALSLLVDGKPEALNMNENIWLN